MARSSSLVPRLGSLALLLGAAACASAARGGPETGAFVTELGTDTVTVERFTRTADRLEGDLLRIRNARPGPRIEHYVATLTPDGRVSRFDLSIRPVNPPPGGAPPRQFLYTVSFAADTATATLRRGDSTQTWRIAGRGALPAMYMSLALAELGTRRLRASGAESVTIPALSVDDHPYPTTFARQGPDTVVMTTVYETGPTCGACGSTARGASSA